MSPSTFLTGGIEPNLKLARPDADNPTHNGILKGLQVSRRQQGYVNVRNWALLHICLAWQK